MQLHECEMIEGLIEVAAATALAYATCRFPEGDAGTRELLERLEEMKRYAEKCSKPLRERDEDDDPPPEGSGGLGPNVDDGGTQRSGEVPRETNPVATRSSVPTSLAKRMVLSSRRYGSKRRSRRRGRR